MKKIQNILIFSLFPLLLSAQDGSGDYLDNIGKIYVVVAVLLILFFAILIFLVSLERRIRNLEIEEEYE